LKISLQEFAAKVKLDTMLQKRKQIIKISDSGETTDSREFTECSGPPTVHDRTGHVVG